VGLGGLGAPAALYLAGAGVGALGLLDPDDVSLSNLQRQVLYVMADLGRGKALSAGLRLSALNPEIELEPMPLALTAANGAELVRGWDLILDGTDDFATRFAVNDACLAEGKPLVSGAIGRWSGQVGVFGAGLTRGRPLAEREACYRCLTPQIPPDAETCALVGVVGALAGTIGSMMALETIKLITGAGQALTGRLMLYDALEGESRTVRIGPDPACPACGGQ
jgi:molybdopterin/thiamine biosynthesis adenylyltransferase